jgi:DNA-binding PadR family transcriptional regulator
VAGSELTPTSYAILGLLSIQDWTTYELATQMDRTLSRFWPRARSKLYEEPKKLVTKGFAVAHKGANGRRPRTVYAITPAGRQALADWLAADSQPPQLESEQVLKTFYAENGVTADLQRTLAGLRAWVQGPTERNIRAGHAYLDGTGPFPERLAILTLTSRFIDDHLEMLDRWAAWAQQEIATWPTDPGRAKADRAALATTVRQAEARASRYAAEFTPEH